MEGFLNSIDGGRKTPSWTKKSFIKLYKPYIGQTSLWKISGCDQLLFKVFCGNYEKITVILLLLAFLHLPADPLDHLKRKKTVQLLLHVSIVDLHPT